MKFVRWAAVTAIILAGLLAWGYGLNWVADNIGPGPGFVFFLSPFVGIGVWMYQAEKP